MTHSFPSWNSKHASIFLSNKFLGRIFMRQLNFSVPLREPKWHTPVCLLIHLPPPPPPPRAGHYVFLIGQQHCCVSLKMKRFILWVTMLLFAQEQMNKWFMCVISEINDPSKEVSVRFMRTSGQYFLLSKMLEKWFPKLLAIFHICSIPSIDNHMCYSFEAIDIKGMCDKIKTYTV